MSVFCPYCTAAFVLGLIGGVVLYFALFADRAHGRRRCPKCWYDMQGAAGESRLRCPECGHDARRESRLYRTRQRWPLAFVGIFILLLAGYSALQIKVQEDGWGSLMPTSALIYGLRMSNNEWAMQELVRRSSRLHDLGGFGYHTLEHDMLSDRQWRTLFDACLYLVVHDPNPDHRKLYLSWLTQAQYVNVDASQMQRIRTSLLRHAASPDRRLQLIALSALSRHEQPHEFVTLLDKVLASSDAAERRNAFVVLHNMLHMGDCRSIDMLIHALSDPIDANRKSLAIFLSQAGKCPDDMDRVIAALERLADDPNAEVRANRVMSIAQLLDGEASSAYIADLAASEREADRAGAIAHLAQLDDDLRAEDVRWLVASLDDESRWVRHWAASGIKRVDPPLLEPYLEKLIASLDHDDRSVQTAVRMTLGRVPGAEKYLRAD